MAGSDGTVWIRREDLGDDTIEWLILDGAARAIAALTLPASLQIHPATRQTIWGVELGEFDEPYVVRMDVQGARLP